MSVYSGLQLLSPLATVDEILADEFEESFGEVVKFLDGVVLDLVRRSTFHNRTSQHILNRVNVNVMYSISLTE